MPRRGVIVRKTEVGRELRSRRNHPPGVRFVALLQRCRLTKPEKFQTRRRVCRGVPSGTPLHVSCWASQGLVSDVIEAVPFAVCSFLLIGVLVGGDKTNNVPPNMNSPLSQMQQGGVSFQTGFTGLTGLSGATGLAGALPNTPTSLNPVNLVNPVQTTNDDISRGWRVESVTTNAAVSYAMPTNATLVGNCHVRGAASSFGNNRIDFDDFAFPLGTNNAAFSTFWYFVDGRIPSARLRATPRTRSARSARRCPPCRAKADCGRPKSRTALA